MKLKKRIYGFSLSVNVGALTNHINLSCDSLSLCDLIVDHIGIRASACMRTMSLITRKDRKSKWAKNSEFAIHILTLYSYFILSVYIRMSMCWIYGRVSCTPAVVLRKYKYNCKWPIGVISDDGKRVGFGKMMLIISKLLVWQHAWGYHSFQFLVSFDHIHSMVWQWYLNYIPNVSIKWTIYGITTVGNNPMMTS